MEDIILLLFALLDPLPTSFRKGRRGEKAGSKSGAGRRLWSGWHSGEICAQ